MAPDQAVSGDITEYYPLSPLQHGMLFHYVQSGRHTGVDIEQLEAKLHEPIDIPSWVRAWNTIAARHPILRTRFGWEHLDSPRQEVVASIAAPVETYDLTDLSPTEQTTRIETFLTEDRRHGFDLAAAPLWRVALFRLAESEQRMVWTYSHAILDSSFAEVLREVFEVYEADLRGDTAALEQRPPYRDHIVWLQDDLRRRAADARAFWRERLAGFVTPTNLDPAQIPPGDRLSGTEAGHDTLRLKLSAESSSAIHRLCGEHDVRVSTFVEAAWALVLGAFSGEDDVVFGSTRAARRSSIQGADKVLGLFINTVPVHTRIAPGRSLLRLLGEVRAEQVAVRQFEHTPLVDILALADVPRGTPLFETIIVFNDQDNDARLKSFGDSWHRRDFELHDQTNFPFNVMAYDGLEIAFKLSYERTRFERAAVERIASLLRAVLEAMAARPTASLEELPRLPQSDLESLARFNETHASPPGQPCVHEAFEAQVDRTPDAVALVFRGQSLTYRDLDERANRVAEELAMLGVGADSMVGLFVERSLEMVVGMLAILKAGGAYVPMDPAYPRERIAIMLEDTRAPVVLTLDRLRDALPATGATVLSLDAFGTASTAHRQRAGARGDSLAYVIFTSGSTGRPKGVQIEHRNVANFFGGMDAELGATPGVWLALTSISFDISVLEILWTLTRGFKVVLQEEAESAKRTPRTSSASTRPVGFSLFYFAADAGETTGGKYRLLLEGAKFADTHGFEAIWTPERHFHPFGGLYPNPSLTSAAVAVITERIAIRAGSIVLPLHNPIRCAEEWSVVDNLSNGRVGLSFASGWHASDFALAPENFKNRREVMARGIETVRALWRGESVETTSADGQTIGIKMYPPPVQREPQIWITASGSPETFALAGRSGASILTNLLVMKPEELVANVQIYRAAYRQAGHPGDGRVTLMLHTFVGQDQDDVRAKVRRPFLDYLRTSTDLINKARWELTAFAKADDRTTAAGATMDLDELSTEDMDAILNHAFERYFASAGLFGTPESCRATVDRLRDMGVDEIACLIDFGVDSESVLTSLPYLDQLRRLSMPTPDTEDDADEYTIAAQIARHGVTHMQCTPSLLGLLAMDDEVTSALSSLRMLLLGGEALPKTLVDRIQPRLNGVLRNMYGPTETTIWSTTSVVEANAPITIGRPIANTQIHIVDRHLRPLPIGIPGELLIGGEGVVRGYLARPELTAERFLADPNLGDGARLYRTGDLARWLPTGELDFLGRLDHQVKIRGYRIELGEIESVLGEHPGVRESVVVARDVGAGDTRLVGYVVPRTAGHGSAGGASTAHWETVWDETYRQAHDSSPELNTAGWKSSFTGEQIPESEMRDWVEATAARIVTAARAVRFNPRVLEIGCGTGMLLFRVAPSCAQYTGVDFSATALAHVQAQVDAIGLRNISLERLSADQLGALSQSGPFDAIVINSVIQYFPDANYLVGVLKSAYDRLAPGGALFVGDVRSLRHLETFHTAIELARANDATPAAELAARIQRRANEEGELVVDPRFFEAVARDLGDAVLERAELKHGRAQNEMVRFRYDVVLRKPGGAFAPLPDSAPWVSAPEPCSLDALRAFLCDEPEQLRVLGVPNARLASEVKATELLARGVVAGTVGDVRAATRPDGCVVDPEDIRTMHSAYDVLVEFSMGAPDQMDIFFRHRAKAPQSVIVRRDSSTLGRSESYVNRPSERTATASDLIPSLREHMRRKLPEYMVPGAFVVLEALPLTPNGKIDHAALPAPDRVRSESATREPPKNAVEREIVAVLKELIGLDEIGVDDNFFDIGANSLLMVQASVRLRDRLGRTVPLVRMFQFPTARSLAGALGESKETPADEAAVKNSQDRAQIRREATQRMLERRGVRGRT